MAPRRRRVARIVAISGFSGSGKTRLLARLIPRLVARGLSVGVVKQSHHGGTFDVRGKDTEVVRRSGALAAVISGPRETAWFGPPVRGARAMARLLPPVDIVLAEGFKGERLPRIEVHRRRVDRRFLCARDRSVFAVVTDEPPPRDLPTFDADDAAGVAALLAGRLARNGRRPGR